MSADTERELHVTKECSQYTGEAGSFCTITSSNIDSIKPGTRVVYAAAAAGTHLDCDIDLEGSELRGHVLLDLAENTGRVTLSGAGGELTGFSADTVVTFDGTLWHWDGTYDTAG
jgi:hypothetical protein